MQTNNSKSALLVMDVQPSIAERLPNQKEYVAKVQKAVDAAHAANILVIYVVVGFRPGLPEVGPNSPMFSRLKDGQSQGMVNPEPVIEPVEGDIVVTKRRVSAFSGSDLAVILSAQDIRNLVLCGIATSGVVLSTVREAADKDYKLIVLADLSADFDDEVQRVLTEKVFPRQAEVINSEDWMNQIKADK